jgi:predicted Zn-dependent protease
MVVDTKLTVTHMVRNGLLKEADAFGLKAAVRAGADPKVVLAYVERMAAEKEGVTKFKELWFEDGRVNALFVVAGDLIAKAALATRSLDVAHADAPSIVATSPSQ